MNWNTPLKEVENLRAQVASLTRERDAAFAMTKCECASDECCRNLVAKDEAIAALTKERDRWRAEHDTAWKNVHILEKARQEQDTKLSTSQAREVKLHDLLSRFGVYAPNECQDEINEALAEIKRWKKKT